jgi:hypothetical protein
MDKLQKLMKSIWRYKERFVLVVLLCFLCFRVYELFVPKVMEAAVPEERGKPDPPMPPPGNPPVDGPGQYAGLYRSNAFSYFSDAPTDGEGVSGKEAGIELLNLKQMPDGRWRAQLKTSVTKKWYDEGEPFEEFKLESINPDDKSVVVYAERFARTITLRMLP